MADTLADIDFLRPWWLCGLFLSVVLLGWRNRKMAEAGWGKSIDRSLLRHLQIDAGISGASKRRWVLLIPIWLGFIALSGPTWQSLPGTVAGNRQAMVIVLDLSPSMMARDIKPDRLTLAQLKLIDILRRRIDGETALVVYAGVTHRVTPLTDDPAVIESLVDKLAPSIMPVAGSQVEDALVFAHTLLTNAGLHAGDILLITDGIEANALERISALLSDDIRLSVLGVGTEQGALIPHETGYLVDAAGNEVVARLDSSALRSLASRYGGRYADVSTDGSDIEHLMSLPPLSFKATIDGDVQSFDTRADAGYWLLLLLLPMVAFLFRRNLIWVLFPVFMIPHESKAMDWMDFWLTPDQQGAKALASGDYDSALLNFRNEQWRAIVHFRQEAYTDAAIAFKELKSVDGLYNLGTTLAMAGNYQSALEAFEQALALLPEASAEKEDMVFNYALVTELLARQQEETQKTDQPGQRGSEGDDQTGGDETSEQEQESRQEASEEQQDEAGGNTGDGETLDQQALKDGGLSGSTEGLEREQRDSASAATPVYQSEAATDRNSEDGHEADTTATSFEQNSNTVLNPYSEQWLRELPQDPGGYLRRKFQYQYQLRLQGSVVQGSEEGQASMIEERY